MIRKTLRLPDKLIKKINEYMENNPGFTNFSEACRNLIQKGLKSKY